MSGRKKVNISVGNLDKTQPQQQLGLQRAQAMDEPPSLNHSSGKRGSSRASNSSAQRKTIKKGGGLDEMFASLGLETHDNDRLNPGNVYNTPYQNNNMSGFTKTSYNNNNRYNAGSAYNNVQNYGVPPLASPQSRMEADVAKKMIMAIQMLDPNIPSLNEFFLEYDVYDGRIFELYELQDIFARKLSINDINRMCEDNQNKERLRNKTLQYKFLFNLIIVAPECPHKFKNNTLKPQPQSVYAEKDFMLQGPLLKFVNELLELPPFATGQIDNAYDELFDKPTNDRDCFVNLDVFKKKAARRIPSGVAMPTDEVLTQFIDYVAYHPNKHVFTKTKFVAAISHLIIVLNKADISQHFQEKMPGMHGYQTSNQHLVQQPGMGNMGMQPGMMQPGFNPNATMTQQQPGMMQQQPGMMQQQPGMMPQQFNPHATLQTQNTLTHMQNPLQHQGTLTHMQNPLQHQGTLTNMPGMGSPYEVAKTQIAAARMAMSLKQPPMQPFSQVEMQQINSNVQQAQQQLQATPSPDPNYQNSLSQIQMLATNLNYSTINQQQSHQQMLQTLQMIEQSVGMLCQQTSGGMGMQPQPQMNQYNQSPPLDMQQYQSPYGQAQPPYGQVQQPYGQNQMMQNTPMAISPIIQELLNRICNILNTQRKTVEEVFRGVIPETIAGVKAYRSQDFIQQCEREFHMVNTEASQIATQFSIVGQPQYIDFMKFSTLVGQEQKKYELIVIQFDMQLTTLQQAFRQRHTGVYKWFQTYMKKSIGENSIELDEFVMAIRNLQCYQVTDQDTQAIFQKLDRQMKQKVAITEIEGLFKEHARKQHPNIKPDDVCANILKAFNCDISFIDSELRKIYQSKHSSLPMEDAMNFFTQFPGFQAFYAENELNVMLDSYVRSQGKIELQDLTEALNRVLRYNPNIQQTQNQNQQGIHQQGSGAGSMMGPGSRMQLEPGSGFSQFSEDCTAAIAMAANLVRPAHMPNIDDTKIEELQKSCYIKMRTIRDYFSQVRGANQGALSKTNFINAIVDLGLKWAEYDTENVFNQICTSQQNGRFDLIQADKIDQAVHFLCKKTLKQMHQEMLHQILMKTTTPNMQPLEMSFEAHISRQGGMYQQSYTKNCNEQQLSQVLQIYNIFLSEVDTKFLASQYTVPGQSNAINYPKLIEDVKSAEKTIATQNISVGDPNSICNAIQKQLHLLKFELSQYFQQHAGRENKYTETELITLLGQRLQLCPEVCTESQLSAFWAQIDRQRSGTLYSNVITQYIQSHAKPILDLKIDIQKRLAEKNDFESRFTMNPVYIQTGGGQQFPIADFQNTLKQFYLPKIDLQFLTSFYEDHMKQFINANQFVKDTLHYRNSGGLRDGPRAADGSQGFDEREARQALAQIAKEPLEMRTNLITQLGRAQQGKNTYVEMRAFQMALPQHMPRINQQMQQVLEKKYARVGNPGQFELKMFQEDLKQLVAALGDTSVKLMIPDDMTKRQFDTLAQFLEQGLAVERFVINLKEMDKNAQGFLNEQMIINAFQDTYKEMNQTNARLPKLSDDQIRGLLRFVNRNKNGFLSYKELLIQTFGPAKGEEFFLSDKVSLEAESKKKQRAQQNRFIMPQEVSNPVDNIMGSIGNRMIQSGQNYEDALKTAIGPNNADMRLTRQQIFDMFNTIHVRPDNNEHQHMINLWWPQCQDNEGKVPAIKFLNDVGLRPQTLVAQQVKKGTGRELKPEELVEAQRLINMVAQDLKNHQKVPAQVIEKHRKNKRDAGMRPKDFALALKSECPSLKDSLSNDKLSILVNYLVMEELGMVSFQKLHSALNLRETDPPLPQDKLQEIFKARGVIGEQLQQAEIPIEVVHLLNFMMQNEYSMSDMFKIASQKSISQNTFVNDREFEQCCNEKNYEPKDRLKLIQALTKKGSAANGISLHILQQYKLKFDSNNKPRDLQSVKSIQQRSGGRFDQDVLEKMNKISRWMQANSYTTKQMHEQLDTNNDDQVDKQEFIQGISQLCIPGLRMQDLNRIFDAIDVDNNRFLSVNEFSLYLEGAQLRIEERIRQLPQDIVQDIEREIMQLFDIFDEDKSQSIDKYELIKTFQGLGYEMNEEKAMNMIRSVDPNAHEINKDGFMKLMKPEMQNRLLEQDDKIEEFRAMFKDADADYSGYLTADEIYTVLLKNGIDLEYNELVELMNEFDASGDAQLDIDEFVAMMNTSSDIDFESDTAKATYLKIRKRSRLSVVDFMKALKNVPSAFVPSVFYQKWAREGKFRPSDVLKAQMDPRTMTWKDMLPVLSESLSPEMQQKANQPKIRPIASQYCSEITLESAEGIPLPPDSADFQREHIKKRAVRIGIFDTKRKEYFANAVQVEADCLWRKAEDKWIFKKTDISLNPVLFRSTKKDDLDLESMWFVFEFVIYYKKGNQNTELCCGWAHTEMNMAKRKQDKVKMDVQGGSPTTEILIQASDVHTKRTGIQGILKVFSSKIKSQLLVSFKPETSLEPDTRFHMLFLPSTCLVQKKLLLFISGYRNYAGHTLLKASTLGNFKKPGGSVAMSCFPKIIDNIDILEQLVIVWQEDVIKPLSDAQKKSIQTPIQKTKEIIHRIYPVLFADEFKLYDSNHMDSVCFDEARCQLRKDMLQSAMRQGSTSKAAKAQRRKPLEEMTTFKPFNVRETQWEVWDLQQAKYEAYINMYQQKGKFDMSRQSSRRNASSRGISAPQGFQQPRMPQGQQQPYGNQLAPGYPQQQQMPGMGGGMGGGLMQPGMGAAGQQQQQLPYTGLSAAAAMPNQMQQQPMMQQQQLMMQQPYQQQQMPQQQQNVAQYAGVNFGGMR